MCARFSGVVPCTTNVHHVHIRRATWASMLIDLFCQLTQLLQMPWLAHFLTNHGPVTFKKCVQLSGVVQGTTDLHWLSSHPAISILLLDSQDLHYGGFRQTWPTHFRTNQGAQVLIVCAWPQVSSPGRHACTGSVLMKLRVLHCWLQHTHCGELSEP
jgi:hypothetical protein